MPRYTTTALISGMRTVHCARAVYTALASVPGVTTADVVVGRAVIDHDGSATAALIGEAIALAGYQVTETTEERQRSLPLL